MFRRRRDDAEVDATEGDTNEVDATEVDAAAQDSDGVVAGDTVEPDSEGTRSARRTGGPFDESDLDDEGERLDLGALRIAPVDDVEVRVEVDQETGHVQAVTFVTGETAMQVGVFAAPRSEGIWDEVRTEIAASITAGGGTVDHVEGDFGSELRARVVGQDDKGRQVTQPVRFVGVDGPRWFLRGLVSGPGVDDAEQSGPLIEAFRQVVVVRGTDPKAPHEPLDLRLPIQEEVAEGEPARPDLNPFRRGPEITEIR